MLKNAKNPITAMTHRWGMHFSKMYSVKSFSQKMYDWTYCKIRAENCPYFVRFVTWFSVTVLQLYETWPKFKWKFLFRSRIFSSRDERTYIVSLLECMTRDQNCYHDPEQIYNASNQIDEIHESNRDPDKILTCVPICATFANNFFALLISSMNRERNLKSTLECI